MDVTMGDQVEIIDHLCCFLQHCLPDATPRWASVAAQVRGKFLIFEVLDFWMFNIHKREISLARRFFFWGGVSRYVTKIRFRV